MTLDPRTQLAQTMLMGLTNQKEPVTRKRPTTSIERDRLRIEQERRSMEALTEALLDPCSTVQEAMLDSKIQRAEVNLHARNRTAG